MADRTVSVRLRAEVAQYMSGIRNASEGAGRLRAELGKLDRGRLDDIGMAAGGIGVALLGMAGMAVRAGMQFDKQMSEVGAVADATAGQLDQLRQAALDAGQATQYSATEAAKAEAELAKAGMSTADILSGGLSGALSLAAAGQMDLADAATITAKAMNMFSLPATSATHIADVFAATANKTAADMHELGLGLQQVGLVANQMGWSLEETSAMLGAFADRGLAGSDGATSLKTALMSLAAPSKAAAKLMQELDLQVYDAEGNFLGASKIAGQLQDTLGGLSAEQRNAAMSTIFGSDAIRAANVLYALGEDGVNDYVAAVYDQGAAADMAAKKTDNLAGDVERLTGSVETLAIEAGSGASGGLRVLVQGANAAVDAFAALPGPVQTTITVLAGVSGVGLLAAAGFVRARTTTLEALDAMRQAGPAGAKAADGIGRIGSALGKVALWGGAFLLAYEGVALLSEVLTEQPVRRNVDELTESLRKFADTGRASGEFAKTFGKDLAGINQSIEAVRLYKERIDDLDAALKRGGTLAKGMYGHAYEGYAAKMAAQQREDLEALDAAMANLVNNGNATQAKLALDQIATSAGLNADQYAQLISLLPQYAAATGAAAAASGGLANGFATGEQAARTMTKSWQEALDKGQSLKDLFTELNGGATAWAQAEISAENSLRSMAEAFDKSGGSIDVHTAKGAAAKQSLLDMAEATNNVIQAKFNETGSLAEAGKVYEEYRKRIIDAMVATGMTREKAEELAATFLRMPKSVTTVINTPGLDGAIADVSFLDTKIRGLSDKTVTIRARVLQDGSIHVGGGTGGGTLVRRWGGVTTYARNGLLSDAAVFAAGDRPLYGFAEPATGGEAFIPRHGDLARSRAIIDYVSSNWLGGHVQWGGSGGGDQVVSAPQVNVVVYAGIGAEAGQISARARQAVVDVIDAYNRGNVRR